MTIFISNVYSFFIQFQENWNRFSSKILLFTTYLLVLDHHLICRSWLVHVEKFSSKELYGILILLRSNMSTSQDYFNSKFANQHLNWKDIYVLPRKINIWENILKLNKILFLLRKSTTYLCSFCTSTEKNSRAHLFCLPW